MTAEQPVSRPLDGVRAVVITCSTRAAAGVYPDRGGRLIVDWLRARGAQVAEPLVVPDGPQVAQTLRGAVADSPDLILTTGGTGVTPGDGTPEATASIIERLIPGIAEAIRAAGLAKGVPSAMLSRGLAGANGATLIINLPGSSGGVKDALEVLEPVLAHTISQLHGGDH